MKIEKGKPGYIRSRRKIDLICLLLFIAAGIAIFLAGCYITKTRANIFTVLAVLLVLPGAKRAVGLIVMLPRKSVGTERYEKVKEAAGGGTLYADYVFTSTEKIMHLDFLLIRNGNVLGLVAPSKQDTDYLGRYLPESVKKICPHYHVKLFDDEDAFLRQIGRLAGTEPDEEEEKALIEFLYASIV